MDKKKISPAIFALAALFFLLPFVTVSCSGHEVATLSGTDLLTGVKMPTGGTTDPYLPAIILVIPAICGIVFGLVFLKNKKLSLISAVTGAVGLLATFIIKFLIDHEASSEGLGTSYQAGFYLMLLSYAAAAGFNGYIFAREDSRAGQGTTPERAAPSKGPSPPAGPAPAPTAPPAPQVNDGGGRLCVSCLAVNKPGSKYCEKCGNPLVEAPKENDAAQKRENPLFIDLSPAKRDDETCLLCPLMKILSGGQEEIIPINKPEFLIGRDKDAVDYWVKDNKYVGRVHAKITFDQGIYSITDLNSKNGTLLNGERLASNKPYKLTAGDKASLANFEFIFIA
ncbi:FHA domain-containing protein [Pelotomaculum propionicicum]|uniref:FHA domain-containing protein n=1 Tax=Pelotomaculum propionicicum TaxID=258475 RepID=UPI003B782B61